MEKALRYLQPILLFMSKFLTKKKHEPQFQIKILDLYLVREVMSPFLYSLLSFIVLYVIYDLSVHFNDFFEKGIAFYSLIEYYFASIPFIFVNATPVALLMAALYCLGQLGKNHEITAFQASGVGLLRISIPFFIMGVFISLLVLLANESLVPKSIATSERIRQEEIKKRETSEMKIWTEFSYKHPYTGRYWVGQYDPDKKITDQCSYSRI